jgi:hypothetical protein
LLEEKWERIDSPAWENLQRAGREDGNRVDRRCGKTKKRIWNKLFFACSKSTFLINLNGGAERNRTADLRLAKATKYVLKTNT